MTRGAPPDSAGAVRRGEELDTERLATYLDRELGGEEQVRVSQFPAGHSNLTYLVERGGREYVLRRPPFGVSGKNAHDMGREHRVLSQLAPAYDKAPRPVLMCLDTSVIGAEFYLMERVPGLILRVDPPEGVELGEAGARAISESFVATLAELHALDPEAIGLGDFGRPAGYVERQVTGWTGRYERAKTDDIPEVERVAAELARRMPASGPGAIIHNDYKLDNLVLDPDDLSRVRGILDWEMATVGDPLMDLGTALCYWVEAGDPDELKAFRFGPTHLPGMMTRREIAKRYAELSGRDIADIDFYYAFGLFKTAVVVQQIYARFARGDTRDPRFQRMILAVGILARQAERTLGTSPG